MWLRKGLDVALEVQSAGQLSGCSLTELPPMRLMNIERSGMQRQAGRPDQTGPWDDLSGDSSPRKKACGLHRTFFAYQIPRAFRAVVPSLSPSEQKAWAESSLRLDKML